MALIFMDGFEGGDATLWTSQAASPVVGTPPADFSGSYYFNFTNYSGRYAEKTLPASKTELYFAFKFCLTYVGTNVLRFRDSAGTVVGAVGTSAAGKVVLYRGAFNSGTLVETGDATLGVGNYYLMEVRYTPLNSGGTFQVKIDGVLDADYSGAVDTTAGLENVQSFLIGTDGSSQGVGGIDDFMVDDASWIGSYRIQAIVPMTGASAHTEWDPSTGDNWDCVNEKPASDADFVSTNVTNEIDTYVAGNLTGTITSIKAVQVSARAQKEDNPTPTQLQMVVRPASTDRVSASLALPTSYGGVHAVWELNPEDSAAWEEADVNGMEFGIKAVA